MMVAAPALDVVDAAILAGKLESVVADMAATLANVAPSRRLSVARDFGCAVVDERGAVVVCDAPLHLPAIQDSVAACLDAYQFDVGSDDMIVTNDPYGGGSSLHYLSLIAPFGVEDGTVAYLAVRAHMPDIGGTVMGNYHPTAWELWQEGARFTPLKIVSHGKRRRSAIDTLILNGRDPQAYRGDLGAVMATAEVGRRRLGALVSEYGVERLADGMAAVIDYSRRRFAAALADIPAGEHRGEAVLEHDGQGRRDLTVRVTLAPRDGGLILDFTGTDEQSAGIVNSPPANTVANALGALLGTLDDGVPANAGLLSVLDVTLPEGTLVCPGYPAPTGWCHTHVGTEIFSAVAGALAAACDTEAPGASGARPLLFSVDKQRRVGGVEEQLGVTDYGSLAAPGGSATAHADGWGVPGSLSRGQLPSVEEFEAEHEVTVERQELRPDSGGAGVRRGALGTDTVIRLGRGNHERLFGAGSALPVPGSGGGRPGAPAALALVLAEERIDVAGVEFDRSLSGGARLCIGAPGGAGYGDPCRRDREAVQADLRNGYISPEAAREIYGLTDAETTAPGEVS